MASTSAADDMHSEGRNYFEDLPREVVFDIAERVRLGGDRCTPTSLQSLERTNRHFLSIARETSRCLTLRIILSSTGKRPQDCAAWVYEELSLRVNVNELRLQYCPLPLYPDPHLKHLTALVEHPSFPCLSEKSWVHVDFSVFQLSGWRDILNVQPRLELLPSLLGDASRATLTSLKLEGWQCGDKWLRTLSSFSRLEKLTLTGYWERDPGGWDFKNPGCLSSILFSQHFPSLTELDGGEMKYDYFGGLSFPPEESCPKLSVLVMMNSKFRNLLSCIGEAPRSLTCVKLFVTEADDAFLERLAQRLTSLEKLEIHNTKVITPSITVLGVSRLLECNPAIHTLILPRTDLVSPSDWCELLRGRNMRSLQIARLSFELAEEVLGQMTTLERLLIEESALRNLVMLQELAQRLATISSFKTLVLSHHPSGRSETSFWQSLYDILDPVKKEVVDDVAFKTIERESRG